MNTWTNYWMALRVICLPRRLLALERRCAALRWQQS